MSPSPSSVGPSSSLPEMSMNELSGMGAETGFELEEGVRPFRFSGLISLLLGLLSWLAVVGVSAIVVPILAIAFGLFALRPARVSEISGVLPARIGILLGVFFGICGVLLPTLKTATLGVQAEEFSKRYIEVIQNDYDVFGIELVKGYANRFPEAVPLEEHYKGDDAYGKTLEEFKGQAGTKLIRNQGPDANWVLDRPVRVYHQFRIDRAEVVWKNTETGARLQFYMQYLIDSNDVGQWHVEVVQPYRELIVAESVL